MMGNQQKTPILLENAIKNPWLLVFLELEQALVVVFITKIAEKSFFAHNSSLGSDRVKKILQVLSFTE